ncbi:MAG: DUF1768 domain-containing protein [Clostridia bacterium]|nr:DUF1768 domain-containing protein [Clostridia bacterium]
MNQNEIKILPTGTIYQMMEEKTLMLPLWLAFPGECQYSMCWRMGAGEDYAYKFHIWFNQFSPEDKAVYRSLFPTPIGWYGWWNEIPENLDEFEEDPTFYSKGDLFTGYWEPTGSIRYNMQWLREQLQANPDMELTFPAAGKASRTLASGWAFVPFNAPAENVDDRFETVFDYVLSCKALFFDEEELNRLINVVYYEPERWDEQKEKIRLYTDDEWQRILPGLLSLGFYYQISQNKQLLKAALESEDDVIIVGNIQDHLLGCNISDDRKTIEGENLLGFALMNARTEIRKIFQNAYLCENRSK